MVARVRIPLGVLEGAVDRLKSGAQSVGDGIDIGAVGLVHDGRACVAASFSDEGAGVLQLGLVEVDNADSRPLRGETKPRRTPNAAGGSW